MKPSEARAIATLIVHSGHGETTALGLLERIFGRADDAAIASALAFWALSTIRGEASDEEVEAVSAALFTLLDGGPAERGVITGTLSERGVESASPCNGSASIENIEPVADGAPSASDVHATEQTSGVGKAAVSS